MSNVLDDQGLHFSLIQPSDLLLVDHDGKVLDESGPMRLLNGAAFAIHSAIHAARPDVLCAAHSHSIHGRAFASLGRELEMFTQDDCAFYGDHVVYKQFNGVVLAKEEGKNIAETLGLKKVRNCEATTIRCPFSSESVSQAIILQVRLRNGLRFDAMRDDYRLPFLESRSLGSNQLNRGYSLLLYET